MLNFILDTAHSCGDITVRGQGLVKVKCDEGRSDVIAMSSYVDQKMRKLEER